MKKIKLYALALLIGGASVYTGCKKYEEGPTLSLRSKKARMENAWKLEKYLEDGVDKTNTWTGSTVTLDIKKDGTYTFTVATSVGTFAETGKWEFIEKNEKFTMLDNTVGSTADTSTILKLKEKELWFYDINSSTNVKEEYHLVPN